MLFQRFESEGLAHYSYVVGDGNQAVVIDPRRDADVYVRAATEEGMRITHVLETHRNEDYVIGSVELADLTGATVLHSAYDDFKYGYGAPIVDDEAVQVGGLKLQAKHTPGHTLGHMSYLLRDAQGAPWVVFTGDALFAGDVGRTDFYGPDRLAEMTGKLYDSLFEKLLPLGDGVILCPAHGPGSVCGTSIAERLWTTVGLERKLNPRLQHTNRADFVQSVGRMLEYPPYFRRMEEWNKDGPPLLRALPNPRPLSPKEFSARAGEAQVLDVRPMGAFAAAHVAGALSIPQGEVPSFAGWFLSQEQPILLVADGNDVSAIVRYLMRMGFDQLEGFLAGGMLPWHVSGRPSERVGTVTGQELCDLLAGGHDVWMMDVRSEAEVERERIADAHHIHVTQVLGRLDEVPRDRRVVVICGSGLRSMIAASILRQRGWQDVSVVLGGISAWNAARCRTD